MLLTPLVGDDATESTLLVQRSFSQAEVEQQHNLIALNDKIYDISKLSEAELLRDGNLENFEKCVVGRLGVVKEPRTRDTTTARPHPMDTLNSIMATKQDAARQVVVGGEVGAERSGLRMRSRAPTSGAVQPAPLLLSVPGEECDTGKKDKNRIKKDEDAATPSTQAASSMAHLSSMGMSSMGSMPSMYE